MEKVRVEFLDGFEVEAEVNGDCYIVDEEFEAPLDLSVVTIHKGQDTEELTNVTFVVCASTDGRFWFAFAPMSAVEIRFAEIEDALCELSMQ